MTPVKRLLLVALLAFNGGCLFIAYSMADDEKINPDMAAFYHIEDKAYATDNGYLAMLGVNAPAGTVNTYGWALHLVETNLQAGQNSPGWETIPDKMTLQGDIKIAGCWLNKGWKSSKNPAETSCTNWQDVTRLITANNILLARYHSQFDYNRFIDVPQLGLPVGAAMLQEQDLFLAYLITSSPGHGEAALQEWMKNAMFLKKALADQNSLIMRSILMVMYQRTQSVLPSLLSNDAGLSAKYEAPLRDILAPFGAREMNIAAALKMDYQLLAPTIRQMNAHNQNKYYQFDQDEIALAQTPPPQFDAAHAKFMASYAHPKLPDGITEEELSRLAPADAMKKAGQDGVMDLIIAGAAVGSDLFKAMAGIDARNRILNLYVQARATGIDLEQLASFLKAAPATLYNPFTGQPFGYDADSKLVYYEVPGIADSRQGLVFN